MSSHSPWSLEREILVFLDHQSFGSRVTRFQIKDFLVGDRAISCSDGEIDSAISALELQYKNIFPEGSLREDMRTASVGHLCREMSQLAGQSRRRLLTKLDELQLRRSALN